MKIVIRLLFIALPLLFIIGCQQQPPPQKGLWKGTVALADQKTLPFLMYLDLTPPAPTGYFLNGSEQTPIPEIYHRGDSLIIIFSEYGAAMRSLWHGNRLEGEFLRYRRDTVKNTFEARPYSGAHESVPTAGAPTVPLAGKYQVYFARSNGVDSSSTATFWAKGDSVFGTVIAPDGDYGLMVGTQNGNSVQLGRFTGWQGQLMELTRKENQWTGSITYRMPPTAPFTLQSRTAPTSGAPPAEAVTMKNVRAPFSFSGVTVMGDTITNLDSRFKGKALIVDIMGTWCHNCMDASPLLQKLYEEFGKDGLEIVGLSFELRDDFPSARKNLLLYEERYGITFPVLFCGSTEDGNVESRLRSQLQGFSAYPTALFVDRNGKVVSIHEGFKGPGTGEEYQQQITQYYQIVKDLLKTPGKRR